jgi:hypothetical protein
MDNHIPRNRKEALKEYARLVAQRWGQDQGEYVMQNERSSFGLLMNAIAHHELNGFGDLRPDLVKAAKAALTPQDREILRRGG